jgi:hypothetical protein
LERRIYTSNAPRLIDGLSGIFTTSGNKTVHASIKVTELKLVLLEELSDLIVMPVAAFTRPLNKDFSTLGYCNSRGLFESLP